MTYPQAEAPPALCELPAAQGVSGTDQSATQLQSVVLQPASVNYLLELVAAGCPVFPCGPDKRPLVAGGFHAATTDPAIIREWWSRRPDALVGLPTGPRTGLTVLDEDEKPGKSGSATRAANGWELPPGARWNQTPSGGRHYLLTHCGERNSASKIGDGVDIRGDGGYVIWYPAHGLPFGGETIPAPPAWLSAAIGAAAARTPAAEGGEEAAIPEGGRNNALASIAGRLRAAGLTLPAIEAALLATNEAQCSPPLDDAEVEQIAASAGGRYLRGLLPHEMFAFKGGAAEPMRLFVSGGELVSRPRPVVWRVRGVIEAETLSWTVGPPNVGKSFFALDLALCIATGTPWFGRAVKPGPVFYIAGEGHAGLARRIKAWCIEHDVDLSRHPFYVSRRSVQFLVAQDVERLLEEIAREGVQPAHICIDTLARAFAGGDENSARDAGAFISACDQMRHLYGCDIHVIHHEGKGSPGGRGSSAFLGAVDAEFRARETGKEAFSISCVKMKDSPKWPERHFRLHDVDLPADWTGEDGERPRSAVIREAGAPVTAAAPLTPTQATMVQALKQAARSPVKGDDGHMYMVATGEQWRAAAYGMGISKAGTEDANRMAFNRALPGLLESRVIMDGGNYRLAFIANIEQTPNKFEHVQHPKANEQNTHL